MATSPTSEAGKGAENSGSLRRKLMIGGAVLLLAGVAAGTGLWRMQQAEEPQARVVDVDRTGPDHSMMPIGRITVNVAAAGALSEKRTRFLVIEPTLLYAASFDADEKSPHMNTYLAPIRDSFIEYLSQLHENDIYGSAGLAELRSELLRRARLVSSSDAPIGILLQDFVLQ